MTKHVFVVLLMVVVAVNNLQAQRLARRTLGSRSQCQMNSAELLASATNENEKAQIEQRIKNGELPEPLIPMAEAIALAEKGDGKGYYQLAVRYAKGEGVEKDAEAAMKFLKKAYDANYPRAIFAVALGTEYRLGKYSSDEVEPSGSKLIGVNFSSAGILCVHGLISEDGSDKVRRLLDMRQALRGRESWEIENGITNEEFTAWVRSDYEKAKSLGIGAAEKELARFEKRIELAQAKVKADLEKEAVRKKNDAAARRLIDEAANKALSLLDADDKNKNGQKESEEDAVRKSEEEERKLWDSWPNTLPEEASTRIVNQTEEKFACVFMYLFRGTNTWNAGGGKALIVRDGSIFRKIDADGKTIRVSTIANRDIEELRYFDAEREKFLESERVKWAKEHGMPLDEAKAKYAKWKEEHSIGRPLGGLLRPGTLGGGSLRARRMQRQQEAAAVAAKQQAAKEAERQAQAEQEKQQREQERAEQRQQLQAIQEELKRVREAKAAAEQK